VERWRERGVMMSGGRLDGVWSEIHNKGGNGSQCRLRRGEKVGLRRNKVAEVNSV